MAEICCSRNEFGHFGNLVGHFLVKTFFFQLSFLEYGIVVREDKLNWDDPFFHFVAHYSDYQLHNNY